MDTTSTVKLGKPEYWGKLIIENSKIDIDRALSCDMVYVFIRDGEYINFIEFKNLILSGMIFISDKSLYNKKAIDTDIPIVDIEDVSDDIISVHKYIILPDGNIASICNVDKKAILQSLDEFIINNAPDIVVINIIDRQIDCSNIKDALLAYTANDFCILKLKGDYIDTII